MDDLISRQAAIETLKNEQAHYAHEDGVEIFYEYNRAIKALKNLPSAQKVGKWIEDDDRIIAGHCSLCGWKAIYYETDVFGMPYCPHCGARMERE